MKREKKEYRNNKETGVKRKRRENINLFIQINTHTDRQTDRQTDGRTDRQTRIIH